MSCKNVHPFKSVRLVVLATLAINLNAHWRKNFSRYCHCSTNSPAFNHPQLFTFTETHPTKLTCIVQQKCTTEKRFPFTRASSSSGCIFEKMTSIGATSALSKRFHPEMVWRSGSTVEPAAIVAIDAFDVGLATSLHNSIQNLVSPSPFSDS